MSKDADIRITHEHVHDEDRLRKKISQRLKLDESHIMRFILLRRSIDARGKSPVYQMRFKVFLKGEEDELETYLRQRDQPTIHAPEFTQSQHEVLIIGAGPCGYYAALRCIELGLRPIVLDRGKDVRARRRDLRQIQQFHEVNPNSNYCFGEGGAGTYSDGKLYTRSIKRGNVKRALQILVDHGASEDILIDSHPHIGSNKLPGIVANMRTTIEAAGGEVKFEEKVVDFIISGKKIEGVQVADGTIYKADAVILCTGHSARDIYELCHQHGVAIAFKPFAMGMRLEHPQGLIDDIQYNRHKRGETLPAASYTLTCQVQERGVFSFCMCPGGLVVPAATSPGELVVNGMSLSKRNSPFANAATVVTVDENPGDPNDPFGGIAYQKALEQKVFNFGDGTQAAPAQRMTDFLKGRVSNNLPGTSYIPGSYSAPLHEILPEDIVQRIRQAMKLFDQKMSGYITKEAQFIGLESRTSAPIRIPRNKETCMNEEIEALFPAGEGAGYAGGILSAALDGVRIADAVDAYVKHIRVS